MKKPATVVAAVLSSSLMIGGVIAAGNVGAVVNDLTASLAGTNVVPAAANGYTGSATFTIDTTTFEICIDATTNIPAGDLPLEGVTIESGAAGSNGAVVVSFPGTVTSSCVTSDSGTVSAILADPSSFYVLLLTDLFSEGALRGQLQLVPGGPTSTSTTSTTSTTAPPSTTVVTPTTAAPVAGPAADPVVATPRFTG